MKATDCYQDSPPTKGTIVTENHWRYFNNDFSLIQLPVVHHERIVQLMIRLIADSVAIRASFFLLL